MKNLLIIAGIIISSLQLNAQTDIMAWQLSSSEFGGTSRFNAMAGAFGALGGDVSVLSYNPAGIGLFRRSEFSFTPAFQLNTVNSSYLGTSNEDIRGNININNIAYVSSKKLDEDLWKNVQFGISYNRLKDFQYNQAVSGQTVGSTFADQLAAKAGSIESDQFAEFDQWYVFPAWETFVIDPTDEELIYTSAFRGDSIKQSYYKESKGRIGETSFSFGANYNDRLYLGGALGSQKIIISEDNTFSETAEYDLTTNELSKYNYTETKSTIGSGFNVKFGMIYRVNDFVRAGLAYHSPSFMFLTTTLETKFVSEYNEGETRSKQSEIQSSDFGISSPSKIIGSMAFVFGKHGLLDVDYEYVDYSKMKLRSRGDSKVNYTGENQVIKDIYQATHNVRVGAEWRVNPFSLRLGTAYYQNPNRDGSSLYASSRIYYTGGVGYKRNGAFVDIAFRYRTNTIDTYLYSPALAESYEKETVGNSLSFTVGKRF